MELNEQGIDTQLMMETSGHGAMKENRFLDDGAYMAVKIVIEMVRRRKEGVGGIRTIIEDLQEPLEAKEYRIKIKVRALPSPWAMSFGLDQCHNMCESDDWPTLPSELCCSM